MSVWRGARVFGATSMGALRAVEAAPVGMVGLGGIHRLVARGEIVSDADLALSFTTEFRALTVPLVNLRHLCRLLAWTTGATEDLERFYRAGSRLHFAERTPAALEATAHEVGGDVAQLVVPYLAPQCRPSWDLKALDAAAAVVELRALLASGVAPARGDRPVPARPDALLNGAPL